MSDQHEIRSTQHVFPMEGWCTEKSEAAMTAVANLVDHIGKLELAAEIRGAIMTDLHATVVQVSRLWAFSCGADWKISDAETISLHGRGGFDQVAHTYERSLVASALRHVLERAADERERGKTWASEVRALLAGDRAVSRTLIHEKLAEVKVEDWAVEKLRDLTEGVTVGELDWEDYVNQASPMVTAIEEAWMGWSVQ